MKADALELFGVCNGTYPLMKKHHSLEFLRGIAHLRARTNSIGEVARVRSTLAFDTHEYFSQNGFVYLHSPIITASDCEGADEMFRITTAIHENGRVSDIPTQDGKDDYAFVDFSQDFFDRPAYLTVSGQMSCET